MEEAKKSFEDQWNAVFDGAEMTPSEHVWTSIDGVLANQQAGTFKKRVLFFKWIAAASVVITLATVTALWKQNSQAGLVAIESINTIENTKSSTEKSNTQNSIPPPEGEINLANATNSTVQNKIKSSSSELLANNNFKNKKLIASIAEEQEKVTTFATINNDVNSIAIILQKETSQDRSSFSLSSLVAKDINPILIEIAPLPDQLYGVADPFALDNIKEKNEFSLWAGLSVSAGTFNPNADNNSGTETLGLAADFTENTSSGQALPLQQINNESLSSGSSISAGIDLRGQVSSRIILSSGIRYLKNNSSLNSNVTFTDNNTGERFALTSDAIGDNTFSSDSFTAQSTTSSFNSEFQYVSIPLKAGYILLDKQFNILLNSGLSTNFLLNANRQDTDGQTQLFGNGDSFEKDYSSVYFNFLSSVEFGYTFQEKYFFSIEPSYSQALTDFTKSRNNFSGKPSNIGVSMGLKYNF